MLTLIALSAVLMQEPPAPPEVRTRFMVMSDHGPGTLDRDGDGQVSREEFAAPMNEHFARADKDGDGRLSTEELSAGHGRAGDGDVMVFGSGSGGESGAHRFELRHPHHPGREGGASGEVREIILHGPAGHGAPRILHAPGHAGPGGEMRLDFRHPAGHADRDKDGDGKLSEAEFTGPLREAFARMDADRSGFIEEGERGADGDVRVFTRRIETGNED